MSTERDELAKAIFIADNHKAPEVAADEFDERGPNTDYTFAIAAALLAAGYRKPRVVTTAEELDALPVGSVVLDDEGDPWHKQEDPDGSGAIWRVPGSLLLESIDLVGCYPTLTVLHEGVPE